MRKGQKAFLLVSRIAQIKTRKGHIFLVTLRLRDKSVYFSHRRCCRKTSFSLQLFQSASTSISSWSFFNKSEDVLSWCSECSVAATAAAHSSFLLYLWCLPSILSISPTQPADWLASTNGHLYKIRGTKERRGRKKSFNAPCSATNDNSKLAGREKRGEKKKCTSRPKWNIDIIDSASAACYSGSRFTYNPPQPDVLHHGARLTS